MSAEHSRALLMGSQLADADERTLLNRQDQAVVSVVLDPGLPGATLATQLLLETLRRLPGRLALDRSGLSDEIVDGLVAAVAAIDSARPLRVTEGEVAAADVRLAIAERAPVDHIRVIPDGYGVQLANDPEVDLQQGHPGNVLGAMFSAALAAAEAFKRIVVDKPERRTFHDHLTFCPVTLSGATAPMLDGVGPVDLAVVGNGAIGTAVIRIFRELSLGGRVIVCDPERYEPENKGTYSLGGEHEAAARPLKVDLAAEVLEEVGYTVDKVEGTAAVFIKRVDAAELAPPRVVLTGLDSVEARRETALLFADHIIDGATGDTGVGLAHATADGPCLRCLFPVPAAGPDSLMALAQETGLPLARLKRGDNALTDEDLAGLNPDQRQRLEGQLGKPVCGLADALGLSNSNADGYRPSVPFVSQMAACLVVGRWFALLLGVEPESNFLQFDALQTYFDEGELRGSDPDCYCQQRAGVVKTLRARRWGG